MQLAAVITRGLNQRAEGRLPPLPPPAPQGFAAAPIAPLTGAATALHFIPSALPRRGGVATAALGHLTADCIAAPYARSYRDPKRVSRTERVLGAAPSDACLHFLLGRPHVQYGGSGAGLLPVFAVNDQEKQGFQYLVPCLIERIGSRMSEAAMGRRSVSLAPIQARTAQTARHPQPQYEPHKLAVQLDGML